MRARADRSLDQIEGLHWDDPIEDEWPLVRRVRIACRKPIGRLTAEDLRLLIGQRYGLETLIPLAVAMLGSNPLVEGDLYPGDLLASVLKVPKDTWDRVPAERRTLEQVLRRFDLDCSRAGRRLRTSIEQFLSREADRHS